MKSRKNRAKRVEEYKPKTEFVKKLLALRKKAIKNGMKLKTVDEILAEKHGKEIDWDNLVNDLSNEETKVMMLRGMKCD